MSKITEFVASLAQRESTDTVANPYECKAKAHNLEIYLRAALESPHIVFIGEAPGYHGCAKTGIPFTSSEQLQIGVHPFIDSIMNQIQSTDADSEMTAKCFWEAMAQNNIIPIAWNVFPFHPHQSGNQNSNRTPDEDEIEEGTEYLYALLNLVSLKCIIAVGGKAHALLTSLQIEHLHVRHPSFGGQTIFKEQIKKWFGGNND